VPRWTTVAFASLAAVITMGHNGSCHEDEGDPLPSPAHALALVLEIDGEMHAELALVSTSTDDPAHVDGAEVRLEGPDGMDVALEPVGSGIYAADGLPYAPNAPFVFWFELDEGTARAYRANPGAFDLAIHGGAEPPMAWIEGSEVAWSPAGQRALIDVYDANGTKTHASMSWDDAAIDASTWRGLPEGGVYQLPEEAFDGVAPHRVRVCAVEVFRRDGEPAARPQHALDGHGVTPRLGWLSGGLAGRCVWLHL
jgi:hypothetical protein